MTDETKPRFTLWQAMSAALDLSLKAIEEVRALSRQPGPQGERGPEGPPGKLPSVKGWSDAVHYEGDIVHVNGSTWQAKKDTANRPPHADWALIAAKGSDGHDAREWTVRGLYDPQGEYQALDVVALNGGSFIAIKDDPGALPGEGWRQLCQRGKAGPPGPQGPAGERGPQGKAGSVIEDVAIKDFTVVFVLSDGAVSIDLLPLFERYHNEVVR